VAGGAEAGLWFVAGGAEADKRLGVTALCVLPDGRLASGSSNGTIRLWDMTTGAESARLEGGALCLLHDGCLASGSHDGTIRLWEVARGAEAARLTARSCCGTWRAPPWPAAPRAVIVRTTSSIALVA
jgi:WD40 repeat protein